MATTDCIPSVSFQCATAAHELVDLRLHAACQRPRPAAKEGLRNLSVAMLPILTGSCGCMRWVGMESWRLVFRVQVVVSHRVLLCLFVVIL